MANTQQYPAGQFAQVTKPSTIPFFQAVLPGTIALSGSVSGIYDLSDWTLYALQIPGTLASGTIQIWAGNNPQDTFRPLCGTGGAVITLVGTLGNQVIGVPANLGIEACRYIELVTAGTQTAAQTINLLVK